MTEAIENLVASEQFQDDLRFLYTLKDRWSAERDYEDFQGYVKCAKENVATIEIETMTKRFVIGFKLQKDRFVLKLAKSRWIICK